MATIKPSELSNQSINPLEDKPKNKRQKVQNQPTNPTNQPDQKQQIVQRMNIQLRELQLKYKNCSDESFDWYLQVKRPIDIINRREILADRIHQQRRCCSCYSKNNCRIPCCELDKKNFKQICRLGTCCPIESAGMICWYPGMFLASILVIPFTPFICIGTFFCSLNCTSVDPVCDCLVCDYQSICYKEEETDRIYDELLAIYGKYQKELNNLK